jgi:hypothetical protein
VTKKSGRSSVGDLISSPLSTAQSLSSGALGSCTGPGRMLEEGGYGRKIGTSGATGRKLGVVLLEFFSVFFA